MNTFNFNSIGRAGKNISLFAGINMIILSVIIFVFPEILAYAVAALFLLIGLSLIGFGMRKRVVKSNRATQQETVFYNI
ncbi:MAG: hypothetical protein JXQ87_14605 [Bacteroidia bacterium]